MSDVRSTTDRLLYTDNPAARADYSRRLIGGVAYFRTLSLEMATRANALAPISRLPKEILVMITTVATVEDRPHPSWKCVCAEGVHVVRGSLGWIRLTHVCKAWRHTLLDAQHLWAQDLVVLPKALPTFIRRTGPTTLLNVHMSRGSRALIPSCEALYTHIPRERVQTISWNFFTTEESTYFHRNIVSSERGLPNLEHLTVDCDHHADTTIVRKAHTARYLLPKLRTLNVNRFYVPFAMPNLTELTLNHPPIPMPNILEDLRASTPLHSVHFERCQFSPIKSPLVLPHLRLLYLDSCDTSEEGQNLYDLLETYVSFPSSTKFIVIPGGGSEDSSDADMPYTEHDILCVLRLFVRSLTRSAPTIPNTLTIDGNSLDLFLSRYRGNADVCDPVWHESWMRDSTSLAQVSCDTILIEEVFKLPALPAVFRSITTLMVVVEPWGPWENVYEALPNVRALRLDVDADSGKNAFEALGRASCTKTPGGTSESTSRLLLPKLSFIWVGGESFCRSWREWDDGEDTRKSVLCALQARANVSLLAGSPSIQTLCLQNFGDIEVKGEAWVQELRKIVRVVEYIRVTGPENRYWAGELTSCTQSVLALASLLAVLIVDSHTLNLPH